MCCGQDDDAALTVGDDEYHALVRCAYEGRLAIGDRVLHDTGVPVQEGGAGVRCGTVQRIEGDAVVVRYDVLTVDGRNGKGKVVHPSKEVLVEKGNALSKAPPETDIKIGDLVRVPFDAEHLPELITGERRQKWQYGIVRYVHHRLLVDVNFDGGEESRGLPAYAHEIQRLDPVD